MNHEVKSAARVLDLMEYLAGCAEPARLKDIVATLGLPKSSAHALAQTLVSRGYAVQDSAERYVLVHGSRHRSATRSREALLLSAAHPVMEALRDRTGETVVLAVRTSRGEVRRLAKCVSREVVRHDPELDAPCSAYCSASGRVLLAHWDAASREAYLARVPLIARTARTVTDPARLRALLAEVAARGYALSDEEHVQGSTGLAAPVRGRDGAVCAALNLGVVSSRFAPRRAELVAALVEAAARVGARLGHPA
jgi:IclR family transcriptional regulator, pca regulon regulatory protein